MSLNRAAITLTANTDGIASGTASLRTTMGTRGGRLDRVVLDRSSYFSSKGTLTISELKRVSSSTGAPDNTSTTTALGRQLCHIPLDADYATSSESDVFYPRETAITPAGAQPTTNANEGQIHMKAYTIQAEVYGANSGDVLSVEVFYESAGDYRF